MMRMQKGGNMTVTSQFYEVNSRKQELIHMIQADDPSYDPVALALKKTPFVGVDLFAAACDRVYFDGYYGPIDPVEWKEQDGRKLYTILAARKIIARVLANVEDYKDIQYCGDPYYFNHSAEEGYNYENAHECQGHEYGRVLAEDIRAEIVYWWREIYPERYPSV